MYFERSNNLNNHKKKRINSEIEKSNNSTFVISIFEVSNFRNIGRSTFGRSKFWPPPKYNNQRQKILRDFRDAISRLKVKIVSRNIPLFEYSWQLF